ncbi:MAG: Na+/H+ antiporter subunit E [Pseudorhodoplanes sp.]|uniref:Na+/H+ antiporter subunit E n=1 Tax=Pseudorhodoplanes sp. TaxID=1934341 RepID=UPI003D099CB4
MASDHPGPRKPRGFLWLWLLLTVIWFAANSSLAIESILTGAGISALLALVFVRHFPAWTDIRLTPARLLHFIRYTGVFLVEMVRANLNMLRYVYSPRIVINPGIVKVRTRLKTPVGRLALANSIALTPGSLVVDLDGDTLTVHWLDVRTTDPEQATRIIVSPFEPDLEKTFG